MYMDKLLIEFTTNDSESKIKIDNISYNYYYWTPNKRKEIAVNNNMILDFTE